VDEGVSLLAGGADGSVLAPSLLPLGLVPFVLLGAGALGSVQPAAVAIAITISPTAMQVVRMGSSLDPADDWKMTTGDLRLLHSFG